MRDAEYVTGEDSLRKLSFFKLKKIPVTLEYIKHCYEENLHELLSGCCRKLEK